MRAHGPTGRVAGAATEMLSGSQPSSSTACPAYVLPEGPCPGPPDANAAPGHHRRSPHRAVSSPEIHDASAGAWSRPLEQCEREAARAATASRVASQTLINAGRTTGVVYATRTDVAVRSRHRVVRWP